MLYEPVLMVWDYWDGPREGLTQYNGQAHYFKCLLDEASDEYTELFTLSPVSASFLKISKKNWEIYKDWERRLHKGLTSLQTHPSKGDECSEYKQLEHRLEIMVNALTPFPHKFKPTFKVINNTNTPISYTMKDYEAMWSIST